MPTHKNKARKPRQNADTRLRVFEALNLVRTGKARSATAAAAATGTSLRTMRQLVPAALYKRSNGRISVKKGDPYSAFVEVTTNDGAVVAKARGSRERSLAGAHLSTIAQIRQGKLPPSALESFRGKTVGGEELVSDYDRLATLEEAGVLAQQHALYVSPGASR